MAINKNFVVKNGLEIATDLIFADSVTRNVGIATSIPSYSLDVNGSASIAYGVRVGGTGTFPVVTGNSLYYTNSYIQNSFSTNTYIVSGVVTAITGTNLEYLGVGTFRQRIDIGVGGTILTNTLGGLVGIASTTPVTQFDVISNLGARIGLVSSYVAIGSDYGRSIDIGIGSSTLDTYLDFHGADNTYPDYASRLYRIAGVNTNFQIVNRGTGSLQLNAYDAGNVEVYTNNIFRSRIDKDGTFFVGSAVSTGTANQVFQVTGISSGAYIGGKVGIGTTNPNNARLAVVPTSTETAGLFSGSSSADLVRITQTGSGNAFVVEDELNADSTPFVIDASGNTGIGTNSASAKLHVLPTTTGIAGLFYGTTSNDMVRITQLGTGNAFVVEDSTNPDSTPFVIDQNGNVGIGTITSSTKLDIIGTTGARIGLLTSYVAISSDSGRSVEIGIGNSTDATYLDFHGAFDVYPDYSTRLISQPGITGNFDIINRGTGNIRFISSDAGAIDNYTNNILRSRITSDGTYLVGTGTSTGTADQVFQVAGISSHAYIGGQLAIGNTTAGARLHVVPTGSQIAGLFSGTTSTDMVRITQIGSGNAFVVEDSADPDFTPFVINTLGQVLVGATTAVTMRGFSGYIQEHGTDDNTSRHQLVRWSLDSSGPVHSFLKSRGATVGVNVTTVNNDSTGELHFLGNDGTDFVRTGIISAAVDGPTGLGSMPGRLVLYTTSGGSSSPVEAMRINSGQVVLIGTATSTGTINQRLQIGTATTAYSAYISGNLGIAHTNPTSKLDVVGDGNFTGVVTATAFNGIAGVSTFSSGSTFIIGSGTSTGTLNQVFQVTGGAYISTSTGIGITNPGASLHVVPVTGSIIAGLFSGSTSNDLVRITQTGTGNALVVEDSTDPDSSPFVVDTTGRVGLGTIAPNTDFQINSTAPTITFVETDATTGNRTWINSVDNQELAWKAQSDAYTSGTNFFRFTRSSSSIQSFEGVTNSSTWFKVDNANQKVGIGSTTMLTQLDVIGSGGARIGFTTSNVAIGTDQGRSIEIGIGNSTLDTYLDFHGAFDVFPDYSTRLISGSGVAGNFDIVNRGTGNIRFISSDVGGIEYYTTNILRGKITPQGTFLVGSGTSTGTANQVFQVAGVSSNAYIGGQVAIGLTLPGARLHVVPTSAEIAGLFSGSSTSDLVRITQTGSGNALVVEDETNSDTTPFIIDTLGNAGVGTNLVGAKLHVLPTTTGIAGLFSGTTSSDMVRITQSGTGNAFVVEDEFNPDSTSFVIDNTGEVGINTNIPTQLLQIGAGTSAVVATGIGSVGIGTLNPTRPLQIQKDSSATNLSQVVIQPLTGTNASGIQLQNSSASNFNIGLLNSSGSIAGFTNVSDPLSGFIGLSGLNPLLVATNNIERLRVDPQGVILAGVANSTGTANQLVQVGSSTTVRGAYISGDIGVGVTNPGAKIHVVPNASTIAGLFSGTTSSDMVRITQLGTGNAFVVEDSTDPDTSPFVIDTTGKVGIGTTLATSPLTVSDANSAVLPNYTTTLVNLVTNTNNFTQLNFTNLNSGNNASGDIVITADTGTDSINYVNLGINNSGFNQPSQSVVGPLDAYLYTSDSNLAIGAGLNGVSKYVSIFTNGSLAANERLRVTGAGLIGVATTNPQYQLDVAGDVRVQNENKMRFGGNSTTQTNSNFYIQYNSTSNSLDFVAG
jgi:hypothetical protein